MWVGCLILTLMSGAGAGWLFWLATPLNNFAPLAPAALCLLSAVIFLGLLIFDIARNCQNSRQSTSLDYSPRRYYSFHEKSLEDRIIFPPSSKQFEWMASDSRLSFIDRGISDLLKASYKEKKKSIVSKKPLFEIKPEQKKPIHPAKAICSQVYYEGERESLTKPFIHKLNALVDFQKSPLLAPLLYVVALGSLGKHREGLSKSKPTFLKAVLTSDNDLSNLTAGGQGNVRGLYSQKSSLFVAIGSDPKSIENNIKTLFHEASHFVALEIMQNNCNPYRLDDFQSHNEYQIVLDQTNLRLNAIISQIQSGHIMCKDDRQVLQSFMQIFNVYSKNDRGQELFVLFAQTISILGYEKGCHFLENTFPEFFNFYKDNFYPKCLKYLAEQNAKNILQLDESFLHILATLDSCWHQNRNDGLICFA